MNLHVPQSYTARAEAEQLMQVSKLVVSPQSNEPVMGLCQDSLLAVQRMTKRHTFIEKDLFFNILMWIKTWDGKIPQAAIIKPRPLWTGKQVFSMLCPQINVKKNGNTHPKNDTIDEPYPFNQLNLRDSECLVVNGTLITGQIDKKTIGGKDGDLIHTTWLEHGPAATRDFMDAVQVVVNYWILNTSFSVGVQDCVGDFQTLKEVRSTIDEAYDKVSDTIRKGQNSELTKQPGRTIIQSFEDAVNKVLTDARNASGQCVSNALTEENNIMSMATAGSKGNLVNISQIIACVGQQNVEGQRLPYGFRQRTLPHFMKDNLGPEARGFVGNSFLTGLTAQEFFFHAMGGREGLIDTAIKTSTTGYLQRRLVKAMESVMVQYDSTVRNSQGMIIQFLYGEDGVDAVRVEEQKMPLGGKGNMTQFRKSFELSVLDEDFGFASPRMDPNDRVLSDEAIDQCKADHNVARIMAEEFEQLQVDRRSIAMNFMDTRGDARDKMGKKIQMPINLERIIWNAKKTFHLAQRLGQVTDLDPVYIIENVRRVCDSIEKSVFVGYDAISIEVQRNSTLLFQIIVRSTLAAKTVLYKHRLTREALDWVLGEIESGFKTAMSPAGEMCGVIAAQSIGQPATQMTLNTFHTAGTGNRAVTSGVPRLNEILNVAKNPKTPSLTIFLNEDIREDEDAAKTAQATLEYATLGDIAESTQVYYDPDPKDPVAVATAGERSRYIEKGMEVPEQPDKDFCESYYDMPTIDIDLDKVSPWVLRIVLLHSKVADKNILMDEIRDAIDAEYPDMLHTIHSDDNDDELILRVRLVGDEYSSKTYDQSVDDAVEEEEEDRDDMLLRNVEKCLFALKLRGIENVTKIYISQKDRAEWTEEGGFKMSKEWVLETDGTNMLEVMTHPEVDPTRVISNSICEIVDVLGIEGCRQALLAMLRSVIGETRYINARHYSILCDVMTYQGFLMSITRHGINRQRGCPLLRASFEETVEILNEAAMYGLSDTLNGVSANIMTGQLSNIGTGLIDVLLDQKQLEVSFPQRPYLFSRLTPRLNHSLSSICLTCCALLCSQNARENVLLDPSSQGPNQPSIMPQSPTIDLNIISPTVSPTGPMSPFNPDQYAQGQFSPAVGGASPACTCDSSPTFVDVWVDATCPCLTDTDGGASPMYSPSASPYYSQSPGPVSPACALPPSFPICCCSSTCHASRLCGDGPSSFEFCVP